jgi:hypothetical protein
MSTGKGSSSFVSLQTNLYVSRKDTNRYISAGIAFSDSHAVVSHRPDVTRVAGVRGDKSPSIHLTWLLPLICEANLLGKNRTRSSYAEPPGCPDR